MDMVKLPLITVAVTVAPFWFIQLAPGSYFEWALCAVAVGAYASIVAILSGLIFDRTELIHVFKRIKGMVYSKGKA